MLRGLGHFRVFVSCSPRSGQDETLRLRKVTTQVRSRMSIHYPHNPCYIAGRREHIYQTVRIISPISSDPARAVLFHCHSRSYAAFVKEGMRITGTCEHAEECVSL